MHFCKICNKGFSCGGALGGHMRAHGNGEVIARTDEDEEEEEENNRTYFLRTTTNRFVNHRNREEEDLANCLVMLANGNVDNENVPSSDQNTFSFANDKDEKSKEAVRGLFQCIACKKVFKSHQALGGHRASHKKVKGCFAAKYENTINNEYNDNVVEENDEGGLQKYALSLDLYHSLEEDVGLQTSSLKRKSEMHECSICKRVFSSGQALGGHKRCHWLESTMPKHYGSEYFYGEPSFKKPLSEKSVPLDLNLSKKDDQEHYTLRFQGHMKIYLPPRLSDEMGENKQQVGCSDLLRGGKTKDQCEVKLTRLGEMRLDGNCSTWLQMGIASNMDAEERFQDLF